MVVMLRGRMSRGFGIQGIVGRVTWGLITYLILTCHSRCYPPEGLLLKAFPYMRVWTYQVLKQLRIRIRFAWDSIIPQIGCARPETGKTLH